MDSLTAAIRNNVNTAHTVRATQGNHVAMMTALNNNAQSQEAVSTAIAHLSAHLENENRAMETRRRRTPWWLWCS